MPSGGRGSNRRGIPLLQAQNEKHIQFTLNDLKQDALSQNCLIRCTARNMGQPTRAGGDWGNYFVIGPKNVCYYGL
jgi:hypothetical protein